MQDRQISKLARRRHRLIRRTSRLVVWVLVGVLTAMISSVAIAPVAIAHIPTPQKAMSSPTHVKSSPQFKSRPPHIASAVQESLAAPISSPRTLFQEGLNHYQAEEFAEAIAHWEESAQLFATQSATSDQALALAYQSLGHQKLGQLEQARKVLAESSTLLDTISTQGQETQPQGYEEIYAKVLNIEGTLHWHYGQLEAALQSWQKAEQFYQRAGQNRGVAIAQMNQAKALQSLGLSLQAESLLRQVYETLAGQSDGELRATGLQQLGAVLRQLGDLETAHTLLEESLALTPDATTTRSILVELGNTAWQQGDRFQAIGQSMAAQSQLQAARRYYEQALEADDSVDVQLNLVSLLTHTGQTDAATHSLRALLPRVRHLPPSRQRIDLIISLIQQWMALTDALNTYRVANFSYVDGAELLSEAIQEAQYLRDRRAESLALGQLGQLYERLEQETAARQLTQVALLKLEGLEVPDIQYRWEWQLGRIAKAKGDRALALTSYDAAVSTLQTVRSNLLTINPDVQFSFRDNVEPIYREFVELLLGADATQAPSQRQLEQAIRSVDQLQLAELENYLGCQVATIGQVRAVADETAVKIYPIVLRDRLVVISQFPGQSTLTYRETEVTQERVEAVLQALRLNLARPNRTPEVVEDAQQLYDWLIRPLEADLQQSAANTLVFVPDGALRNVPMAVLFDGEQYLIEKGYAVAIAPRLDVFLPNAAPTTLHVNLGGVGIAQKIDATSFPRIEKLEEELNRIAQFVKTTPPLLDEAFTVENIQQQLQEEPISAIHWKTHGVFSSDPAATYLVGYNQRIDTAMLNDLIQTSSQGGTQPLELLVLSACETAQGDRRAVLGLAGLAARTGTRSVLSTLWIALDTPNTEFMVKFYQSLIENGTTKAEAVRQAQLSLINDYGYTTPYIWANYMLIGNWL